MTGDLEIAHELAERAGALAMEFFVRGVEARDKPDGSPVTEADDAVERLLRRAIDELTPGDAVLGEELGAAGASERTWIVDPIDGTSAFARREENWRVQIALQVGDDVTAAVVAAPAMSTCWWAARGGGAFESTWPRRADAPAPRPLRVSEHASIDGARASAYPRASWARMPASVERIRITPLALIDLVRGDIDAYFAECCEVWDHAPWILIVQEAGGRFTDHEGGESADKRGGLYSNAAIHDGLLRALRPSD